MVWFPHVQAAVDLITKQFGIAATTYPGHDDGLGDNNAAAPAGQLAADLWPHGAPADQTEEIAVMNWVYANRVRLNARYVVGNGQKIKNVDRGDTTDGPWRQMAFITTTTRYNTDNHYDHVHVTFLPAWALSNPSWAGGGVISQPASGQLCEGVDGEAVKALQRRLDLLGYNLVPDGEFGPKTAAAVKDFQLRHHLVTDGIVGPATQAALAAALLAFPPAGPFAGYPVLRQGDHGSKVVTFQRALNALRADPALVADGDFGALTTARTRDLQALAGLVVDGVAGPVTLAAVGFYLACCHVTL